MSPSDSPSLASAIPVFQKPVEAYSLNSCFTADVPFMLGFHKPVLNDPLGPVNPVCKLQMESVRSSL